MIVVYKILLIVCIVLLTIAKYELEKEELLYISIDAFIIVIIILLMFGYANVLE